MTEIRLTSDPAPFREWLRSMKPTEKCGVSVEIGNCPLACYLRAKGLTGAKVRSQVYEFDDGWLDLPEWSLAFRLAVDKKSFGTPITVRRALKILNEVSA